MNRFVLFSIIIIMITISCNKDDDFKNIENEKRFLVDKIYDYNNNLLADYIYDENNRLVKRVTTDPINNRSSDYEFEYEDNNVKNIKYIDHNFPQFNHNTVIFYDEKGEIVRDETYQYGNLIGHRNYVYFPNGQIKSIVDDNGNENYFFNYNGTPNVIQVKLLVADPGGDISNDTNYIEIYRNFKYDNTLKPDFGIGNIFQIEPLPYFGSEALFEKNISKNNMTEFVESGTTWIYEYNEYNLPSTIETKWKDIETLEPMLLRIKYKEVN